MKKVVFALSLCAVSSLFAYQDDYKYEFTPIIGGSYSEGQTGYKPELVIGATLARNFENAFIDQVEVGFNHSMSQKFDWKTTKKDASVTRYFVNAVSNLVNFSDATKLYGLAGVGYEDWTRELHEVDTTVKDEKYNGRNAAEDTWFGQYGLGLKHYWTDNFSTKLEVKDMIRFNDGSHTMIYTLGFGADFGRRHPAPVNAIGDSDGDGVPDNLDRCPDTPANVVVDENGCEKVIRLKLGVNFKLDSAVVSPSYKQEIAKVADFVKDHADYKIKLDGYTDSTGSASYNLKLSDKRAKAVKAVLVDMGVSADRISTKGYGESNPIATNATKAGRAENRRVEARFNK